MTDSELLTYAAKAAELAAFEMGDGTLVYHPVENHAMARRWNPLTDDGDALRLAVKLKIDVKQYDDHVVAWFDTGLIGTGRIPYEGDPLAATRRAIVRAAAEIGKVMP